MSDSGEAFGQRLLTALKQASVSQTELANRLEVSKGLVSQWVAGSKECPEDRVQQIAAVLNADLGYLQGKLALAPGAPEFLGDWYFRETSDGGRDYGNPNVFATPPDIATLV